MGPFNINNKGWSTIKQKSFVRDGDTSTQTPGLIGSRHSESLSVLTMGSGVVKGQAAAVSFYLLSWNSRQQRLLLSNSSEVTRKALRASVEHLVAAFLAHVSTSRFSFIGQVVW